MTQPPSSSSSIRDYFPNIRIRTMAKDLEATKAGGGVTPESEKVSATQFTDFVAAQQKLQETAPAIMPPEPGAAQQPSVLSLPRQGQETGKTSIEQFMQRPPVQQTSARPTGEFTMRAEEPTPTWLYAILGLIAVTVIGSVGYWIVYPQIQARLARMRQTPAPVASASPSPTPAPIDPSITLTNLPANAKRFTVPVSSTSSGAFINELMASYPSALPSTGTVAFFSLPLEDGEYVSSRDLVQIFAPKSLPSFQATLDEHYLLFAYWYKMPTPALGVVFSVRPEQVSVLRQFMTGWETARIEEDFQPLFSPAQLIRRTASTFTDALIAQVPVRSITVSKDGEPAQFLYAFVKQYLVVATNAKAFEAVAQQLNK